MIQHFILTRSDYSNADERLRSFRESLRELTSAASIERQTRQDFQWLLTGQSPQEGEWTGDWWSFVESHLLPETTHVLTTRLDDDDILADDFVERLRGCVRETDHPTCYVFPNGMISDGSKFGRMWHTGNMFCSLLSPL